MIEDKDLELVRTWAEAMQERRHDCEHQVAKTVLQLLEERDSGLIGISLKVEVMEEPEKVGLAIAALIKQLSPTAAQGLAAQMAVRLSRSIEPPDESV